VILCCYYRVPITVFFCGGEFSVGLKQNKHPGQHDPVYLQAISYKCFLFVLLLLLFVLWVVQYQIVLM